MQKDVSTLLASLLLAFTLTGVATANATEHSHHAAMAPAMMQPMAPPAIAARFDLSVNNKRTDWYLWREADAIETANTLTGENCIWQRVGQDAYNYRRIFHVETRIVEYVPGELKTRHIEPDWQKLGSVISPHLLKELKPGSSKTMFGQKAVRYVGRIGGQKIDLWWLEVAQLPARLQMTSAGQHMTMNLKELRADSPAGWPRADEQKIAAYGLIDAADFGDMESDPFVARIMRQEGHTHAH